MLKTFYITIIMLINIFFLGCSEQDDCTADLNGEIIEINTQQSAANTMATIKTIFNINDFTVKSIKPVTILDICNDSNISSYYENVTYGNCKEQNLSHENYINPYGENRYNYILSNFSISNYNLTNILNIEIGGETSYDENTNETFIKTSISGDISVVSIDPDREINLKYKSYSQVYKKEYNKIGKYEIDGVFSYIDTSNSCTSGIYQLETTDKLTKFDNGGFSGGILNVNGTLFKFNDGGTADVTFSDGSIAYGISPTDSYCN